MSRRPAPTPPPLDAFTEWVTSSNDGSGVYISHGPEGWIALRDSDDPSGAIVRIPPASWATFTAAVRDGQLS